MKEFNIFHFASTVIWWLNYITAVGRDYIISESTLKIPLTEYLGSTNVKEIHLEYSHPFFQQKRFDLFFKDETNSLEIVFEFKFVKKDSTRKLEERTRVFYDLMRLQFYLDTNKKAYFLICGNQFDFNTSFYNLNLNPPQILPSSGKGVVNSGFYSEWFSFDKNIPLKIINLRTRNIDYKNIYKEFINNYKSPYFKKNLTKLVMPKQIKTNLIYLSKNVNESNTPQTMRIGIWEIIP